ncbi:hypothetical protein C7S18_23835 (plasmid) [Ahniella affigens]|uniref:Uncharacterized protein n=1 Tax=Ahniella affigens TaxID=2021234 RepID=A0A2P1PZR4_9GAMM|nr:hypothetical protein C7S18_23835 [Ahniella affigens]
MCDGWVSPHILDAPDCDLVLVPIPEGIPTHDALVGYWAGMLIAGTRASTARQALQQASELISKYRLSAESTQSLRMSHG